MATLFQNSVAGTLITTCLTLNQVPKGGSKLGKLEKGITGPHEKSDDGDRIVVSWDAKDDPHNPLNWSLPTKCIITAILNFYTLAIFIGSSLCTSSYRQMIERFNISETEAELGLALYVLGYGTGCLLFSPLTEIPAVGRNPPYAVSGTLFILLCIPSALVDNYAGLMVLRFLLGFVGSPCLATVPASLAEIWGPSFPVSIGLWAAIAPLAPSLGPLISAFAVESLGWQFWAWELLIIAGASYILLVSLLPETSTPTILYYRAKRLRDETGDLRYTSESESKQSNLDVGGTLWFALVKPWEINIKDPAMLFTTIYTGLQYGIVYSFFESFPLVYPVVYDFSATSTALTFLTSVPGAGLGFLFQVIYLQRRVLPKLRNGTFGELENFLPVGIVSSSLMPIGLFIFGWTSRASIHWMVPTIGMMITMLGVYLTMQSIFLYIPSIYPKYAASIFAANSLARSLLAFAAVLFTRPMIERLGIAGGISLVAGLTLLCAVGMVVLWRYGKVLRARSQFAVD